MDGQAASNFQLLLPRCNKKEFVNPVAFPIKVKQQIEDFSKIHPFLETTMNNFKGNVKYVKFLKMVFFKKNMI